MPLTFQKLSLSTVYILHASKIITNVSFQVWPDSSDLLLHDLLYGIIGKVLVERVQRRNIVFSEYVLWIKSQPKVAKFVPFSFFLYAIATKTASANVKSHIEKNEKKIHKIIDPVEL